MPWKIGFVLSLLMWKSEVLSIYTYAVHFPRVKVEQNYLIFLAGERFYAFYLCQVNPAEREREGFFSAFLSHEYQCQVR